MTLSTWESRNKSLEKSDFVIFLSHTKLPTKALLELIFAQNNIAFAIVYDLHTGKSGGFHWLRSFQHNTILRKQRGQDSDVPLVHMQFDCQ